MFTSPWTQIKPKIVKQSELDPKDTPPPRLCSLHTGCHGFACRFWSVVALIKDEDGRVKRMPYLEMNIKLQKALTPAADYSLSAAMAQARR